MEDIGTGEHIFVLTNFGSPTWCDHCKDFIWGIAQQGYQCKVCHFNTHPKCRRRVQVECGGKLKPRGEEVMKVNKHTFQLCTYNSPTWCDNCNNFIWGFQNQGWKCASCGVNSHGRCVVSYSIPCFLSHPATNIGKTNSNAEDRIVLSLDGYFVEDGQGGISPGSFEEASIHSIESETSETELEQNKALSFQNPQQDAYFAKEFVGKGYILFIMKQPDPMFITALPGLNSQNKSVLHLIFWFPAGKVHSIIDTTDDLDYYEVIAGTHPDFAARKFSLLRVAIGSDLYFDAERLLIALEQSQCAKNFTVSVLYDRQGQRDPEKIMENSEMIPEFEEFLELVAQKIQLENYNGYAGGLDTKNGTTGQYSYAAQFCGNDIMFHVGPLLPLNENSLQSSLSMSNLLEEIEGQNEPDFHTHTYRKEFITHNTVCVIFLPEKLARFSPAYLKSKYIHSFIIVQPIKQEGQTSYRLNVSSKETLPEFGPKLPSPPVFSDLENFKNFLLAKIVNSIKASFSSEVFQIRRKQAIGALLVRYEEDFQEIVKEVPRKGLFQKLSTLTNLFN